MFGTFLANLLWKFLGIWFPSLAPPDPVAVAQANKDRADSADSLLKAKVQSDAIETSIDVAVAVDPRRLRDADKFELK